MQSDGGNQNGERNSEQEHVRHKVWLWSFWKFHAVVVQNNGQEMYIKSVLHVQSCFFAN